MLLGIRGKRWGWLVRSQESAYLDFIPLKDQNTVHEGYNPLLGIDKWEHACYLQYLNDKGDLRPKYLGDCQLGSGGSKIFAYTRAGLWFSP